jgi:hypothetical protein
MGMQHSHEHREFAVVHRRFIFSVVARVQLVKANPHMARCCIERKPQRIGQLVRGTRRHKRAARQNQRDINDRHETLPDYPPAPAS